MWADEVTLWSEDFSSYSANDVPSGGTYNYTCGGANTKIYDEFLAGGSAPELLLQKSSNGTFTATIPLDNIEGDLTLTFKTNNQKIKVETTTEGLTGSLEEKASGTHTVTFEGVTTSTTSITIKFTCSGSSNVRLDDIVLTGTKASGDTPSLEDSDLALTDAPVALSFDLYNNASTQVINYTTSSTGTVTIDENDYATFSINETNKTITVTPKAVTPSTQTITVNQAADENYKAGSSTFTLTITDSTPIPTHTVTFSVNGVTTTQDFEEGAAITFPENPTDIEGKTFFGWTASAIEGTTDEAPDFVTSAKMAQNDVTYYAVFATASDVQNIALEITATTDGVPSSYGTANTFSEYTMGGVKFQIMQMYKSGGKLQWRAAGNSNGTGTMYNDESLGKITSVVLTYNSSDSNKNFTLKVGNSKNPTEGIDIKPTVNESVYTFDCSSKNCGYFVFTNGSGAGYLDKVVINYSSSSITGYCTIVVADTRLNPELSFAVTEVNANISEQFEAPTLSTAEGFNGTVEYTSSDESVAQIMDSETGDLMLLKEGTATITATFAGNDGFRPGSASYTLTVTDNRIATTISVEDIVLDIADIETLTQLSPVVKDADDNIIDCTYEDFPPKVSYEIVSDDNYLIGSLDNNSGEIILNEVLGTATLKASYNAFNVSSTYKPSECTFTITVENVLTISEARAQSTGSVTTKGVVTSCSGTTAYIQDASAAICVYGTALTVGDEIKVSGTLTDYNGLLEITSPSVTVLSQNNTVTPEVMTIADIALSDKQGWLVKIEGAMVTAISGKNTTIAQGDNTIVVRGIDDEIAVNDVITLTGNIGCYNTAQIANPTDVTVATTLDVTITDAKFATFSNAKATDFSEVSGITVYKAKVEGEMVSLTKIEDGIVPANTGVILYSEKADTYQIPYTTTDATISDNELVATTTRTFVTKEDDGGHYNYILQKEDDNVVFKMAKEDGAYMPAGRAYLSTTVNAGAEARLSIVFDDETTGIRNLTPALSEGEGAMFDLQGRRVNKAQKGLYIMNGKKMVIK